VSYLVEEGFLDRDGELLFIGPEAERKFGHRNFMDMTAVFTAPPQFTVLAGRQEIGQIDPKLLTEQVDGPRVLLLGGRSWKVTWTDWKRRRCFVEETDLRGKAHWQSLGAGGRGYALARAARDVLLGATPPVKLTRRATRTLTALREEREYAVVSDGLIVARTGGAAAGVRWWTWAGRRANATLAASLPAVVDGQFDDLSIRLQDDVTPQRWREAVTAAAGRLSFPDVDERALAGLKFSAALPPQLATDTLAARLADLDAAAQVLAEPVRFTVLGESR
jgi:ATP-dependent Lhr-like helicase